MAKLTRHGAARLQQRSIPSLILDLLDDYGVRQRNHGADLVFFNKAKRNQIRRLFGVDRNMRLIEPYLNTMAVFSDTGHLITATPRTRRIRRP